MEFDRVADKHGWAHKFQDNVQFGFVVSEKHRKIQLIEVDLLYEFDRACRKYDLKYFIAGGTLLGAVRHKGFIPWDDDVDVMMLQKDYDKLLYINKIDPIFEQPYFLQTPETDPGYYYTYARLRNSNTSAVVPCFSYEKFNQGIALDIFPLYNCIPETASENWNLVDELAKENSANMRRSHRNPTEKDKLRLAQYPPSNPQVVYSRIMEIVRQYDDIETEYVGFTTVSLPLNRDLLLRKSLFNEVCLCEFEGLKVFAPCPLECDAILKLTYGNWEQFPRMEDRHIAHDGIVYDPDKSYLEYISH